jgi:hypothetical protein
VEYSIHKVLHTLSTAYTAYCIILRSTVSRSQTVSHLSANHVVLKSLHSHNYQLTNAQSLSSCRASLPNYRLQIDRLLVLLQSRPIMASKCMCKLVQSRPPSVSLNSQDYGLQVHLQTRSITAFKCISKLVRLRPPSVSPNLLDYSLQVYLQTRSIRALECVSKFTRLRCGETVELVGRQPIINTPPHVASYLKGIHEIDRF